MNNDLISREALIKWIDDSVSQFGRTYSTDMLNMWGLFKDYLINNAPTVPQCEWIPVSQRLPEDLEPVNITWINHEPEPYYKGIKDKPFTATGVYFNGEWYWWSTICTDILAEYSHNYDDVIDTAIEVIAWRPLPEPYKEVKHGC